MLLNLENSSQYFNFTRLTYASLTSKIHPEWNIIGSYSTGITWLNESFVSHSQTGYPGFTGHIDGIRKYNNKYNQSALFYA